MSLEVSDSTLKSSIFKKVPYLKKFHIKKNLVLFTSQALMEDMQMRLTALESVKNAAEDLIKQASNDQDEAVQGKLFTFKYK